MTGRELIKSIVDTVQDLEAEVPVQILHRAYEGFGAVTKFQSACNWVVINGKILIEAGSIKDD